MKASVAFFILSMQLLWIANAYRNCPAEITSQKSCSDFCLQKDSTGKLKYVCRMYDKLLRTYDSIAPNVVFNEGTDGNFCRCCCSRSAFNCAATDNKPPDTWDNYACSVPGSSSPTHGGSSSSHSSTKTSSSTTSTGGDLWNYLLAVFVIGVLAISVYGGITWYKNHMSNPSSPTDYKPLS